MQLAVFGGHLETIRVINDFYRNSKPETFVDLINKTACEIAESNYESTKKQDHHEIMNILDNALSLSLMLVVGKRDAHRVKTLMERGAKTDNASFAVNVDVVEALVKRADAEDE